VQLFIAEVDVSFIAEVDVPFRLVVCALITVRPTMNHHIFSNLNRNGEFLLDFRFSE
jgi:hypothetical protein